jgi:hypothetical protein
MALVDISVNVDIATVIRQFNRMASFSTAPLMRALRRPTFADQKRHRDQMRGPQGPWKRLAPSTLEKYARMGIRRNRRILAKLPLAKRTTVTAHELVIRSPVRWSMAHFRGAIVGRGSRLPQRQYWWISPRLIRDIRLTAEAALMAHWNGRSFP